MNKRIGKRKRADQKLTRHKKRQGVIFITRAGKVFDNLTEFLKEVSK